MKTLYFRLRRTRPNRAVGVVRILLGLLFLSTGLMKLLEPDLRATFSGQLAAAELPFHSFNVKFVPIAEAAWGFFLLLGFLARPVGFLALIMMAVATYVHLVVHDPELFPVLPQGPMLPVAVLVLCVFVIWAGAGSWSADLSHQRRWGDRRSAGRSSS